MKAARRGLMLQASSSSSQTLQDGWVQRLPGMVSGLVAARCPGTPVLLLVWSLGGEPWQGVVLPGEPCWRWIHLHWLFLVFGWIHLHHLFLVFRLVHLHGLYSICCLSHGRCYHVAGAASRLTPPPLLLWLLKPPVFSPAQNWAVRCLAPLGTSHSWQESTLKVRELRPTARVLCDIRRM